MSAKRLVFTEKQQVGVEEFTPAEIGPGDIHVKTQYSLMSTGTENICFNRLFSPGMHWDDWVKYPFYPGYSTIGTVVEKGASVADTALGDRVALRTGHASDHVVNHASAAPVPKDVDPKESAWFALAKIGFRGANAAERQLGDTVLIIGAGPIGQMALRWAVASGARVVVIDPVEMRLSMAKQGGASAVISRSVFDCRHDVLDSFGGEPPRIVIDTTGHSEVFAAALGLAANFGRRGDSGRHGEPH